MADVLAVTPPVIQHVRDARAHLARRRQHRRVIAIAEHASPPADRAIDELCRRDQEALHPLRERDIARGLDDQVKVSALDAEVDDANALVFRERDGRVANARVELTPPQCPDPRDDARDDVDRRSSRKHQTLLVPFARPIVRAWPSGAAARAAAPLPILVARVHACTLVRPQ
ncbi:MAG TPA: hypothetical protein VGG28_33740 [Kofleriaceae bacterium]